MTEQVRQFSVYGAYFTELYRPISLTFCMDVELLQSAINLVLINNFGTNDLLDDEAIRSVLNDKAVESKTSMTMH